METPPRLVHETVEVEQGGGAKPSPVSVQKNYTISASFRVRSAFLRDIPFDIMA